MKSLFYLLLPMFVLIALLFSFQNRDFNFISMLSVFSNWTFDNGYQMLLNVRDTFVLVSDNFQSISNSSSFFESISALGLTIANFFVGIGQLFGVVAAYFIDLVTNVGNVLGYFFGW